MSNNYRSQGDQHSRCQRFEVSRFERKDTLVWRAFYKDMEYLVEPDIVKREEDCQLLEIDPQLLLRKDHLAWLFHLINSIPQGPSESVHFCISCSRYLMLEENPMLHKHQYAQGPHHLFPLIRMQRRDHGMGSNYYVSIQALREIQVPIGDVLSHMLPHPPRHGMNVVGHKVRCMYVHPPASQAKWQGAMLSGRCAYRDCERIFPNRQSHLRLYGITPQFCSISCKLKTWLCCNKWCGPLSLVVIGPG